MSEQHDVQQLLREGIDAARDGDKATARARFERVVELEENNEKGWYWLASVVETDEEKRVCLGNVLFINPENERAQAALDKLNNKEKKKIADEEVVPGITRRQLILTGGVGAIVIVILFAIVFLIISSNNSRIANEAATGTAIAQMSTSNAQAATDFIATTTAVFLAERGTSTPTASPTFDIPTWTPTPTETAIPTAEVLPAPQGLVGSLAAWSGQDVLNNGFLPIVIFPLNAPGQSTRVGQETGRNVTFSPDGQRIVYTRYFATTFDYGLEAINPNGTQSEFLAERWRRFEFTSRPEMPQYSRDGTRIVFIAVSEDTLVPQVYLLNLTDIPPDADPATFPSPILRLTNDSATYSYPSLSPDGSRIAVVKNDRNSATAGEDIVIIDIASAIQSPVTTDLSTFVEQAPRWSPDGTQIIYTAASANEPQNNDIVIRNADGSGTPVLPIRDPGNDLFPLFSPDGRNIAFSSNRSGVYDIYIYDIQNASLSQLTNSPEPDFPGDWWQPAS